jgi:hypothetical protein
MKGHRITSAGTIVLNTSSQFRNRKVPSETSDSDSTDSPSKPPNKPSPSTLTANNESSYSYYYSDEESNALLLSEQTVAAPSSQTVQKKLPQTPSHSLTDTKVGMTTKASSSAVIPKPEVKSIVVEQSESEYYEYSTEENQDNFPAVGKAPISKPIIAQPEVKSKASSSAVIPKPEVKSTAPTQLETTSSESSTNQQSLVQFQNQIAANVSVFRAKVLAAVEEFTTEISKAAAIFTEAHTELSQPSNSSISTTLRPLSIPDGGSRAIISESGDYSESEEPPKTAPPRKEIASKKSPKKPVSSLPVGVQQAIQEVQISLSASEQQKKVIQRKPLNIERKSLNRDRFDDRESPRKERKFPRKDVVRRKTSGKVLEGEKHKSKQL